MSSYNYPSNTPDPSALSQDDRVIQDIQKKINRERGIAQGATALKSSTSNPSVQQKCDANIREAQKNIEYLEERLRQLQIRKRNSIIAAGNPSDPNSPSSSYLANNPISPNGPRSPNNQQSPYQNSSNFSSHSPNGMSFSPFASWISQISISLFSLLLH